MQKTLIFQGRRGLIEKSKKEIDMLREVMILLQEQKFFIAELSALRLWDGESFSKRKSDFAEARGFSLEELACVCVEQGFIPLRVAAGQLSGEYKTELLGEIQALIKEKTRELVPS